MDFFFFFFSSVNSGGRFKKDDRSEFCFCDISRKLLNVQFLTTKLTEQLCVGDHNLKLPLV